MAAVAAVAAVVAVAARCRISRGALADLGASDALPVVLIHGHPFNRTLWEPRVTALVAAGYRVIAPDLRGYGNSVGADDAFTPVSDAEAILRLVPHAVLSVVDKAGHLPGAEQPQRFNAVLLDFLDGRVAGRS